MQNIPEIIYAEFKFKARDIVVYYVFFWHSVFKSTNRSQL